MANVKKLLVTFLFYNVVLLVEATREICSGIDITNDQRLNRGEYNGVWFSQYFKSSSGKDVLMDPIFFFQDEGKTQWIVGRNAVTGRCKSLRFVTNQKQTTDFGPFSPCFNPQQTNPVEEADIVPGPDSLRTLLGNLAIFYSCQDKGKYSSCRTPLVRVLSRSVNLNRKDIDILQRELRRFNLSLSDLQRQTPDRNGCGRPKDPRSYERSRGY